MHDRHAAARAPGPAPRFLQSVVTERVVLGFDFGERRTGVAIANTVSGTARALTTIEAATNEVRWTAIEALQREWQPSGFVVGIPRHPDGTPHALTARCERFARQLEGRFGLPVARVDERYTSAVAAGERDVDAAAATLILQQWLGEQPDA
jgi:putative Holliday junction resolvase